MSSGGSVLAVNGTMTYVKLVVGVCLLFPLVVVKIILTLLGLIIVPVGMKTKVPRLYRASEGRPWTFWEMAVRNPVGGLDYLLNHPADYLTYGYEPLEPTLQDRRFAWRVRQSGVLVSFRCVWRYSAEKYGELYVGWKLGSEPPKLDFATSLRPWAEVGQ